MQISLLTYNLYYGRALPNLKKVLSEYKPDIVTVQEIETSEENLRSIEKMGFKLADYSNSFFKHQKIYGIATYYNEEKIKFNRSQSINLPRGVYEILLFILRGGNNPRTVLTTDFSLKSNSKNFTIYNLHLTTWGTNGVRIKQIKETFQTLDINNHPSMIAGDFNFTYGRRQFEMLIERYSLKEATNNIIFTMASKFLNLIPIYLKVDYILYQNIKLVKTEKIDVRYSDHYPIISYFDL